MPINKVKLGALSLVATLALSVGGYNMIEKHEGVRYKPYLDSAGIPTVCVGSTKAVVMGKTVTKEECVRRFKEDSAVAEKYVKSGVQRKITQLQYDVLVSFVFNVGGRAFTKSTLLRELNAGRCDAAAAQFNRWVNVTKGGKLVRVQGLVNRRAEESLLFLSECPAWK
jgi:lysozyme